MTTGTSFNSRLEDSDVNNLVSYLSAGERSTPTSVIGSERFPSIDQLVYEMRQNPVQRERNAINRLDMFSKVGVIPLASNPQTNGLILGVNYLDRNGGLRDAVEINMSLDTDVLPYDGYSSREIEIVLLDQVQFNRLSKLVYDNAKRMATTSKISTALSNPTTRERFYQMVGQAIQNRVSDIHIEPLGTKLSRVRFRIDGSLSVANIELTGDSYKQIVSMIKNDAGLRIDESRRPQDGAISFDSLVEKHPELRGYSLRVSTAPINHGEKVALRVLKEQRRSYGIESIGYPHDLYLKMRSIAESPDGLVLVTGPTGSGKTTTLYSLLNHLNTDDVNIVTIEDPIEANLPGINQTQVNRATDWNFSHVLKTFLRQDPDIILVGEIRDSETAKAAMEAAKTGHLVLSTLHTVDSVSTLFRLYELGVESSDLQSSLNGVVAQRLVRKVCPSCVIEYDATSELNSLLNTDVFSNGPIFHKGTGIFENESCKKCSGIGYYDRMVVPEVWVLGDDERNLIGEGCKSIGKYNDISIRNGLKPLAIAGMEAVAAGKTTLDEIIRNVARGSDLLKRKAQLIDMLIKK